MDNNNIGSSCFAYDKAGKRCIALEDMLCRMGKCPFYKTVKQARIGNYEMFGKCKKCGEVKHKQLINKNGFCQKCDFKKWKEGY